MGNTMARSSGNMAQTDDIGFKNRFSERREGKGPGSSNEAQGRCSSPPGSVIPRKERKYSAPKRATGEAVSLKDRQVSSKTEGWRTIREEAEDIRDFADD